MANTIQLVVTDFQKVRSNTSATVNNTQGNGFLIIDGDYDRMNRTSPNEDTIYGITNSVANKYCRDRYAHIVVLSLYNRSDRFIEFDLKDLNKTMDNIDNIYMTEEIPVLFINVIAREIYLDCVKNPEYTEIDYNRYAQETADVMKKYGYIDIGCNYRDQFSLKNYVMIRANDIGTAMITNNFEPWW